MNRRIVLWIVIGVMFLATLFLTFNTGSVSVETVQASVGVAKAASTGMVGGC